VIGCLNSDQATISNATSTATTSDEDESDFFNFPSVATFASQKHLEFLNNKNGELTLLDNQPSIKQLLVISVLSCYIRFSSRHIPLMFLHCIVFVVKLDPGIIGAAVGISLLSCLGAKI